MIETGRGEKKRLESVESIAVAVAAAADALLSFQREGQVAEFEEGQLHLSGRLELGTPRPLLPRLTDTFVDQKTGQVEGPALHGISTHAPGDTSEHV